MLTLRAVISGAIGAAIGILITWLVSFIFPTPWTIGQAFIAVGVASFFAAFFGVLFNRQRR
jgi:uncharacterized protein YacL